MIKSRKSGVISQKNNATCISNRRGMAKKAKRNSSKKDRQISKKEASMIEELEVEDRYVDDYEIMRVSCGVCGEPHEMVRPGKTQPTCICDSICDICGGRKSFFSVGEDKLYPNMTGEWCSSCGPFGDYNV